MSHYSIEALTQNDIFRLAGAHKTLGAIPEHLLTEEIFEDSVDEYGNSILHNAAILGTLDEIPGRFFTTEA